MELSRRRRNTYRNKIRSLEKNAGWLNEKLQLLLLVDKPGNFPVASTSTSVPSGRGRPRELFLTSSERSKKRKTKQRREQSESKEPAYDTQMSLRAAGESDAASLVQETLNTTSSRPLKMMLAWLNRDKNVVISDIPEKALALFVKRSLTKRTHTETNLF